MARKTPIELYRNIGISAHKITYRYTGGNMVVAGLMSDAQELMAMGHVEAARQMLNRAKAILFDIMDGHMSGGAEVK